MVDKRAPAEAAESEVDDVMKRALGEAAAAAEAEVDDVMKRTLARMWFPDRRGT